MNNKFLLFICFSLQILIVHCTLYIKDCSSQWVYQALPSYHCVVDIKFFDENTGILIYYDYPAGRGMLRSTNGGINWVPINNNISFFAIQKIDSTTLYALAFSDANMISRTFNRGITWDSVSVGQFNTCNDLSFVNRDTGWISGSNNMPYPCIWKTTNGGVTIIQQTDTTGLGKIFFLKNKINGEYYGWHYSSSGDNKFWKTTNSGNNWFQIIRPPAQYLGYFSFIDENTGWFTWGFSGVSGGIYKTTNGGINWINQFVPSGNGIHNTFTIFKIINYDTIYGGGGYIDLGSRVSGLIWKTINGGLNWGYQKPDTNFYNGFYGSIDFINSNTGWAYEGNGIHTTNGGGPIIFTNIRTTNSEIPKSYILYQNYPNPFNPTTKINYDLPKDSKVTLVIYDILGRQITKLVNGELQKAGAYSITFNGQSLASGVYFYRIVSDKFVQVKKMVLIK